MNTEDKEIDVLTRKLMEGTTEEPSPSLNSRIMALIMREKHQLRICYIRNIPSVQIILVAFMVYMLLLVGGMNLFKEYQQTEAMSHFMKQMFPLILTAAGGISFFFFFAQLDNWLRRREMKKK